jgi:hypothetical protein
MSNRHSPAASVVGLIALLNQSEFFVMFSSILSPENCSMIANATSSFGDFPVILVIRTTATLSSDQHDSAAGSI